jgi:tetratricopeptide (TPR) repeat protein
VNDVAWLPSLLVLGIGLALGLAATVALRRGRKRKPEKATLELQLRDLEERRDDLYRRLRSSDLDAGDRESLELAAAHTLRELDRLAPRRSKKRQRAAEAAAGATAAGQAAAPEPPAEGAPPAIGKRHPALVGFVAGMAVVLLVGTLVYLAVRDSGVSQTAAPAAGSTDTPHPEAGSLPTEVQRELERLEAAAAAAPTDLLARKRLALARLDAGLYFDAFADAEAILASQPEDPDGLYIQGVVRLSMGQSGEALDLLDRVIARYPEHLRAMIYRGLALAQRGDLEQAIATWEMGLEMAGGSHPDIENLLREARAQGQPPPAAPPAASAPAAAPPARPSPPPAAESYQVTVELAAGRSVSATGVLFVFLRPGESGPPVAVKRIPAPRFPVQLALTSDDAMMAGAELPAAGTLVARLAASGNATSRSPEDLEASAPAALGQPLRLVLGGS